MAALRVEDVPVATSALVAPARPDAEQAAMESATPPAGDFVRALAREVDQALEAMRLATSHRGPSSASAARSDRSRGERDPGLANAGRGSDSQVTVDALASIAGLCARVIGLLEAEHAIEDDEGHVERAFDIIEVLADESVDRYRRAIHPWMAGAPGGRIDDDGARLVTLHHDQLVEALGGVAGLSAERITRLLSVSWALSVIALQVAVLGANLEDMEPT